MFRTTFAAAAALLAATAAQAGEPPSAAQEVQIAQAALGIMGYDPGPIDAQMGPQTRAAVDAFLAETGAVVDGSQTATNLSNTLLTHIGPALTAGFGTDPTGTWDIDWVASGLEDYSGGRQTCEGSGRAYFSGGIVFRDWEGGFPIVFTLADGRLETLPLPSGDFIEPHAFEFVDDNTLHRQVEGETEVWVRCDDWREDPA